MCLLLHGSEDGRFLAVQRWHRPLSPASLRWWKGAQTGFPLPIFRAVCTAHRGPSAARSLFRPGLMLMSRAIASQAPGPRKPVHRSCASPEPSAAAEEGQAQGTEQRWIVQFEATQLRKRRGKIILYCFSHLLSSNTTVGSSEKGGFTKQKPHQTPTFSSYIWQNYQRKSKRIIQEAKHVQVFQASQPLGDRSRFQTGGTESLAITYGCCCPQPRLMCAVYNG